VILQSNLQFLINQPVGVSLVNGQGVSGILCGVTNNEIYLLQYMYQSQFAMMHYYLNQVQAVHPFPSCYGQGPLY
jgi:hypothetical protein